MVKDLISGLHNFTTANLRGKMVNKIMRKPAQETSVRTKKPKMKEDVPKFLTLDLLKTEKEGKDSSTDIRLNM